MKPTQVSLFPPLTLPRLSPAPPGGREEPHVAASFKLSRSNWNSLIAESGVRVGTSLVQLKLSYRCSARGRLYFPCSTRGQIGLLAPLFGYWGQTPIWQNPESTLRHTVPHPVGEPKARRIWALTPKTPGTAAELSAPAARSTPHAARSLAQSHFRKDPWQVSCPRKCGLSPLALRTSNRTPASDEFCG